MSLEITVIDAGLIRLAGRFDAEQVEAARQSLGELDHSCVIDCSQLDYISSAGLGFLFAIQKRLHQAGAGLTLRNLRPTIREMFEIAGFDTIFRIE